LVPKRALVLDGSTSLVYRLGSDDSVERVVVETSLEASDVVAVPGGLAVGDRVVVAGQAGLKAGSKVRVVGGGADVNG
jgi:multidrug efflux pump subunit AcrA (membrane-fusion protein)